MTMLPALKGLGARFRYIASAGGVNGALLARKYGFTYNTTNYRDALEDPEVNIVMITTRHSSHAHFVQEALHAGKHVFVEKPLALTRDQLEGIIEAQAAHPEATVMVGFNRRFSPHIQAIRKSLGAQPGPLHIVATMNAGAIPLSSWVHDLQTGGGRILGEACHYIDLCVYLAGAPVTRVCMNALGPDAPLNTDNASILLQFANGSNAVVNYFANGSRAYSKERLEIHSRERTWVMDNFRETRGYGVQGFRKLRTRLNKGHKAQFQAYLQSIREGRGPLIPFAELVNVADASFAALQSLQERRWVEVVPAAGGNSNL